ncbi:MAG: diaminopimelate epimerase, partial [Actinomycetota bacterium]
MAELTVWKYHGTGNDFVMLEDLEDERPLRAELIAALCDRHRGIGADGVIRITRADPRTAASFFMDYWNADGSVAEMCGNGTRVFAQFLRESGADTSDRITIATRAGDKSLTFD